MKHLKKLAEDLDENGLFETIDNLTGENHKKYHTEIVNNDTLTVDQKNELLSFLRIIDTYGNYLIDGANALLTLIE